MYDTIIIGGGPAAIAAGVYAARKKMHAAVVTETIGGQSIVSAGIENWIGEKAISGIDLAKKFEAHLRAQEDLEIVQPAKVTRITRGVKHFIVHTKERGTFETKTVIIATGGRHRRLNVPGEDIFDGKGVAYCATCDAQLFRDKNVAVVGGGNSGLEAVIDLLPYAKKVYLLTREDGLKGDPVTQEKILSSDKVEIIYKTDTQEILGETMVTGLRYKDLSTDEEETLSVGGVFVEVGSIPNAEFVKDLVALNKYGEITIDHKTGATSTPGIFAAGDVTDEMYKQNNIAAGDGIKALLSACNYIQRVS